MFSKNLATSNYLKKKMLRLCMCVFVYLALLYTIILLTTVYLLCTCYLFAAANAFISSVIANSRSFTLLTNYRFNVLDFKRNLIYGIVHSRHYYYYLLYINRQGLISSAVGYYFFSPHGLSYHTRCIIMMYIAKVTSLRKHRSISKTMRVIVSFT